jgi:hypothetical protein
VSCHFVHCKILSKGSEKNPGQNERRNGKIFTVENFNIPSLSDRKGSKKKSIRV